MSKITLLAECTLTAFHTIAIELVEANETPAVVIVRWPAKATVIHPAASRRRPPPSSGLSPWPAPSWPASGLGGGSSDRPTVEPVAGTWGSSSSGAWSSPSGIWGCTRSGHPLCHSAHRSGGGAVNRHEAAAVALEQICDRNRSDYARLLWQCLQPLL
jgi:hypothetical protein